MFFMSLEKNIIFPSDGYFHVVLFSRKLQNVPGCNQKKFELKKTCLYIAMLIERD